MSSGKRRKKGHFKPLFSRSAEKRGGGANPDLRKVLHRLKMKRRNTAIRVNTPFQRKKIQGQGRGKKKLFFRREKGRATQKERRFFPLTTD